MDIASTLAAPQMPQANMAQAASNLQSSKNKKAVDQASVQFEALFMNEMIAHMFEGVDTDGPFGGGHGEEVFRSLMIEEYGKKIAESGQTHISQTLAAEMLKMQELQQKPNSPLSMNGA
jgi:peptidoglycan hydrolase FlgJ